MHTRKRNRRSITILRNSLKKCLNQFLRINKTARQKDRTFHERGKHSQQNKKQKI